VFPRLCAVIFVHGCFWHGHHCARGARVPKANRAYWVAKVARNKTRDGRVRRALKGLGWRSLVVWECELSNSDTLRRRLSRFLSRSEPAASAARTGRSQVQASRRARNLPSRISRRSIRATCCVG
jgi:DNA mismatch endonuclease (patch repair protein)